jgi:hypothetical protein
VEFLFVPITYQVIKVVKKHEPTYRVAA